MMCRKCKKLGDVLVRVNEKGVTGAWECSPYCDVTFVDSEAALIYALDLSDDDRDNSIKEILNEHS